MALDISASGLAYTQQRQLAAEFTEMLDLHLYYLYKYRPWIEPDDRLRGMMGVTVPREEFEENLLKAADFEAFSALSENELDELGAVRSYFMGRLRQTVKEAPQIPLISAGLRFGLDFFEFFVLLTAYCCELNSKYEKLFQYIQDDITKKRPTVETLIRLFAEPRSAVADYFGYFSEDRPLCGFLCEYERGALLSRQLRLSRQAFDFIAGVKSESFEVYDPADELHPLYAHKEISDSIARSINNSGNTSLICLIGGAGSGRRFLAKHCARQFGKRLVLVRAEELLNEPERALSSAVCAAVLKNGAVCVTDLEVFFGGEDRAALARFTRLLNSMQRYIGAAMFITAKEKWYEAALSDKFIKLDFELPETDEDTRLTLWEKFVSGTELSGVDLRELSAKFRFSPGQIRGAARQAAMSAEKPVTAAALHDICYGQVVVGLDTLASPIKPAYSFDDLVLPERELNMIKEACSHVKYKHTVYSEWGFGKKAAYGRGLSVLFSGPPGTGKTMAAQAVTRFLNMKMYKIQISQIVSKYIGETEKNLRRVFEEAKSASCILFFDEMDALFGKRSEVKDSHDRNANIETAFLLQQMEEYDGVVLMATNLLQNIDEAFMRRINFVVQFPFPDEKTRAGLWRKMLDAKASLDENIDYGFLGDTFKFSGGNIKNCVIHAAFAAAAENAPISMRHLIGSAVDEMRKNNIVVVKEQLKEYADLIFAPKKQ